MPTAPQREPSRYGRPEPALSSACPTGGRRARWLRAGLGCVLFWMMAGSRVDAQTAAKGARERAGVPVVFEGETIAVATGRVGAFSPAERAAAINQRLRKVTENWELDPGAITVQETLDEIEIVIGEQAIMVVTNADAAMAGKTRKVLAAEYALKFRDAVFQARDRHSLRWVLTGVLKTLGATAALIAGLVLMRILGRRILRRLDAVQSQTTRQESLVSVLIHGLSVLLSLVLRMVVWPVVGIALLTYLHVVLGWFPSTALLARQQHDSLMRILGAALKRVLTYLPNLAIIVLIVVATRFLLKVVAAVLEGFEHQRLRLSGFHPDWARPTYKLIRLGILALMLVVLYPYLPGSNSDAFRGVSVFIGVLISLGSGSLIANAAAGTIQTYMRALQPGDFVQIGEYTGTVIDKTLLVTRIRTVKNVVITIPNSMTLTTPVRNSSVLGRQVGVILHFEVSIAFEVPWRTVHGVLLAATENTPGVLSEPPPFINQTMLARTHVAYELNVYTDEPSRQAAIFTALNQNIQDGFHQAGIAILVPTYVNLMGDGSPPPAGPTGRRGLQDGVPALD